MTQTDSKVGGERGLKQAPGASENLAWIPVLKTADLRRRRREARLDGISVVRLPGAETERTTVVTRRTRRQSRTFELLEVKPDRTVPINMTG